MGKIYHQNDPPSWSEPWQGFPALVWLKPENRELVDMTTRPIRAKLAILQTIQRIPPSLMSWKLNSWQAGGQPGRHNRLDDVETACVDRNADGAILAVGGIFIGWCRI
jgi:hypothetical protein